MKDQIPPGIISSLQQDPVRNCNILYFIYDNPILEFYSCGDSLMVKGVSDREWIYFSSADHSELQTLLDNISGKTLNFAALENWMLPLIINKFNCTIELTTTKFYLPEEVVLPGIKNNISPLLPEQASYVLNKSSYKEFLDEGYITTRIKNGISGAIFFEGKPEAWGITHDDGAIGFLQVDEKYQRKGFAADLTSYMAKMVRGKGRIPFVHIEKSNYKSIQLAQKTGFLEYGEVSWVSNKEK